MQTAKTGTAVLPKYQTVFLNSLSGVNVGLGLLFYVIPSDVIPYWPWPVQALAVRFLGAIFLAIALGCWSAVKAKLWQRSKILVLVGGTFFGLTGIVTVYRALVFAGSLAAWAWTSYFLAAAAGCLLLVGINGWRGEQAEVGERTVAMKGARVFFGVQTSVVGVFGAMMVLVPSIAQEQFWPWIVATPTLQTFGALFLATCVATGWAFSRKDPTKILVLLPLDAVFPTLALLAVGIHWNVIVSQSPSWLVTEVWLGLYSFVAAGSTILYFTLVRRSSAQ